MTAKKISDITQLLASQAPNFVNLLQAGGVVSEVSRSVIMVRGLSFSVAVGDMVSIDCGNGSACAEVMRVASDCIMLKPYDDKVMPPLGALVFPMGAFYVQPDISWRGRVLDALARPIDQGGPLLGGEGSFLVEDTAPPALQRARVGQALRTGVRVIDLFTPLCFGQRVGIFAGSGVGKSTLLAMLCQASKFDTVVLALTGERGREVRDMLDDTMAGQLDKVVTIVATSDESAMMRRLAPLMATTIAQYFAGLGQQVLLVVDSLTRYALAAREVAIAAGEPPVSRGFPPRVFAELPKLLERAGPAIEGGGSITGVYSVLVEGDDHNDPIADTLRGILDGHIVLDRSIAAQGRFPAVNILNSISRLSHISWTDDQKQLIIHLKAMIMRYEETRDLRAIGAYKVGGDGLLDQAVNLVPKIYEALKQAPESGLSLDPYAELSSALTL